MAKGQRSKVKKALRTQAREKALQTPWLVAAEEKRMAAMQACLGSEPVEVENAAGPSGDVMAEDRGREGQPAAAAKMDVMEGSAGGKKRRGKKGVSVKGVDLKKKQKKGSTLWGVFDAKKTRRKGRR